MTPGLPGDKLIALSLEVASAKRASDLQFRADRPLYLETQDGMECVNELGNISKSTVFDLLKVLLASRTSSGHGFGEDDDESIRSEGQIEVSLNRFLETRVLDFSCDGIEFANTKEKSGRLRVQAHLSASGLGITIRVLSDHIPELETLGLAPDIVHSLRGFATKRAGLALVTGPTGSGKSTTLASLIDWVRRHSPKHIVTVEDPVEYRYPFDMVDPADPSRKVQPPGIITQQEVGRDVHSYRQGLKDVLRKAPHIILLGEIRDREAMETCIEAAQTGHMVLSTLHTTGAVRTLGRILEFYPQEAHAGVLGRLSEILLFILSQGLLKGYNRRVLTYEYLQNNDDAVSSGIVNYGGATRALDDVIRRAGNVEWDANLYNLYKQGIISQEVYESSRLKFDDELAL